MFKKIRPIALLILLCSCLRSQPPNATSTLQPQIPAPTAIPTPSSYDFLDQLDSLTLDPALDPYHPEWSRHVTFAYINDLGLDHHGNVWTITFYRITQWNLSEGTYINHYCREGINFDLLTCIAVAPHGDVWVGTDESGVFYYDGTNWTTYRRSPTQPENGPIDNEIIDIDIAPDGTPWVATPSGVSHFDGQAWTNYSTLSLIDTSITQVEVSPAGTVWALPEDAEYAQSLSSLDRLAGTHLAATRSIASKMKNGSQLLN